MNAGKVNNLTIIIPHYNSPKQLDILLNSIGVHDDVEVIVVDDNSTKYQDEYHECMNKYSQSGVIFLNNDSGQNNAGSARNVGLKNATGKWLLFSDADDYFTDGWYQTVKNHFCNTNDDIIHFIVSEIDTKYNQTNVKKAVLRYNLLCQAWLKGIKHSETMLRIYFYAPWSKMIRHSMVVENDIHFDSIKYSNDLLFSTMIGVCAKRVSVCPTPIYFHVTTEGSLSTIGSEEAFFTKQISYCKRCDYLYEHMEHNELKKVNNNEGARRLFIAAKRKYGIRNIMKYLKMFLKHHVPVFTIQPDEITRLKWMLRHG